MQDLSLDGGTIRKLWIGEADIYREHLLRLDVDSRRNRFGGAVSDDLIRMFVDQSDGLSAVLHGYFVDGNLRGVGELRLFGSPMSETAEAAFSIEKPWQSHGVGSALLERTILAARNRGIKHLHMMCLPDNRRMQQLRAQVRRRSELRFRQRAQRYRSAARHAFVDLSRTRRRRARLCDRLARCPGSLVEIRLNAAATPDHAANG